ncbi:MAG: peroxiredoxin [Patescibacteria group bacterium]
MNDQPRTPTHVPEVIFYTRVRDESIGGDNPYRWQEVTSDELFAHKRVLVFALPGAFTPTCDAMHLPGYEEHYSEFQQQGIDAVYCLSVNDAFVMNAWGKKLGVDRIELIPDGNAEFTTKMGMLVSKENLGFGMRSWRYSMLVDNKEIIKMFIEDGFGDNVDSDPFEVSDADTMLAYLNKEQG